MASLSSTETGESVSNLSPGAVYALLKAATIKWFDDDAPSRGAAVAFYTLFSLGPVVLITLAIAGLIFGVDAARGAVFGQMREVLGAAGASAIEDVIGSANKSSASLIAEVVGPITFIMGVSAVFVELQTALNGIWRVSSAGFSVKRFIRVRLLSFALVVVGGFLLTVSLVLNAGIAAFGKYLFGDAGLAAFVWLLQSLLSLVAQTIVFTLIYRNLPDTRVAWRDALMGAAVAALLFSLGKFLISFYLAEADVISSYGAAGAFILILLWVYYACQIFLFGAQIVWVRQQQREGAVTAQAAVQEAVDTSSSGDAPAPRPRAR